MEPKAKPTPGERPRKTLRISVTIPVSAHSKLEEIQRIDRLRSVSQAAERLILAGIESYRFPDQESLPLGPGRRAK